MGTREVERERDREIWKERKDEGDVDKRRRRRKRWRKETEKEGGVEEGEIRGVEGRRGERYLNSRHGKCCFEMIETISRNIKEKSGAAFQNS